MGLSGVGAGCLPGEGRGQFSQDIGKTWVGTHLGAGLLKVRKRLLKAAIMWREGGTGRGMAVT